MPSLLPYSVGRVDQPWYKYVTFRRLESLGTILESGYYIWPIWFLVYIQLLFFKPLKKSSQICSDYTIFKPITVLGRITATEWLRPGIGWNDWLRQIRVHLKLEMLPTKLHGCYTEKCGPTESFTVYLWLLSIHIYSPYPHTVTFTTSLQRGDSWKSNLSSKFRISGYCPFLFTSYEYNSSQSNNLRGPLPIQSIWNCGGKNKIILVKLPLDKGSSNTIPRFSWYIAYIMR